MITVFGHRGFIGRNLVARLEELGELVNCLNIEDDLSLLNINDFGIVFYAVGVTANFRDDIDKTVDAHVVKLQKALKLTSKKRTKFILISSTRVYINSEKTDPTTMIGAYPYVFDDLYTSTKLVGETICLTNRDAQIIRVSNVIGQNPSSSFFLSILNQAREGHIVINSSLSSCKDYILIDDAVEAIIKLSKSDKSRSIENVAMGENTTTDTIINEFRKIYSFSLEIKSDDLYISPVIDISGTQRVIEFSPRPIRDNLIKILRRS